MGLDELIPEDDTDGSDGTDNSSDNSGSVDGGSVRPPVDTVKKDPADKEGEIEPYEILQDRKPCPECGEMGVITSEAWMCETEDCEVDFFVSSEMIFYDNPDKFLGNVDWSQIRENFSKSSDWSKYMDTDVSE